MPEAVSIFGLGSRKKLITVMYHSNLTHYAEIHFGHFTSDQNEIFRRKVTRSYWSVTLRL